MIFVRICLITVQLLNYFVNGFIINELDLVGD